MPRLPDAAIALRDLVEAAANQRHRSLLSSGLRLFDDVGRGHNGPHPNRAEGAMSADRIAPFEIGRAYELGLAADDRRRTGAHLTPEAIARGLLNMLPRLDPDSSVLDPAVGGAAFLLVAADHLVTAGADPASALDQLHGVDIDPGAVAAAEAALALWALDHEIEPRPLPNLRLGDGMLDDLPTVDCVVGNPPFLNQLNTASTRSSSRRAALRERWGELMGAYTDDAWLFLAAGIEALDDRGTLAMVQPMSLLAARHGEPVRRHAQSHASMAGLWVAVDRVFDAAVQVCGVVFDKDPTRSAEGVVRRRGASFDELPTATAQPTDRGWGTVASLAVGAPSVALGATGGRVGDLADATAGFRDQFYGFAPFVTDESVARRGARTAPLITVGMIDVLGSSWADGEFRFAKTKYRRPVVDLDQLAAADPSLAAWSDARRRPKLLMATQTRVIEIWVDHAGTSIPATPVLSIEPHADDADMLWKLAAALSAPSLSAYVFASKFGTAMSLNALKLAARDVLDAPLPHDAEAWAAATSMLRHPEPDLAEFGRTIDAAYGVDDPVVVAWWLGRFPNPSNKVG